MEKDGTKPTNLFDPKFMKECLEIALSKSEKRILRAYKRKLKLIKMFGDQCKVCKMPFKSYMYDFHHVNPENKMFKLSGANLLRKWKSVLLEAHKCVMVCPNCHRYLHNKEN